MKRIFAILFLSFTILAGEARQQFSIPGFINPGYQIPATAIAYAPASGAEEIIQSIISAIGLKPNFEVKASSQIPNAAAVTWGGKRYILYNPVFISNLTKAAGNNWAAISVLAHEIGHHLNGHTLDNEGSQPDKEIEADEFSGFVLNKMGASLADAQAAMKIAADARGSATHPGQYDRLAAIARGWDDADGQSRARSDMAVRKITIDQPQQQQVRQPASASVAAVSARQGIIDDAYIAGDLLFRADPNTPYYLTVNRNIVQLKNNKLSIIGKLANLNNSDYPYYIYDSENNKMLIDKAGTIFNMNGKVVGLVKVHKG